MKTIILILAFTLSGCGFLSHESKTNAKPVFATCQMNGFVGFPKKVKGQVVIQTRNVTGIATFNLTKTERVDMIFPIGKCKVL